VDFEFDHGYYRIAKVYEGGAWDTDTRSVLRSLDKKEREQCRYMFKVNGTPVDTSNSPWAAFEALAGKTVTLTVGATPNPDKAINVVVKLLDSERNLRYRHWVETNRQYVEKKSQGRVGYIYVPDTKEWGESELLRQFYGQVNK